MRAILVCALLSLAGVGCAVKQRPEPFALVPYGPARRHFIAGYSESMPRREWNMTPENSEVRREFRVVYRENSAYEREPGRETLFHFLDRKPEEP